MRAFEWLRAGLVLGLASGILWAAAPQNSSDDDDDDDAPAGAYAFVFVTPQLRGDVRFLISWSGTEYGPDLTGILQRSLGCDWRKTLTGRRMTQGTCRRLLAAQHGAVRATLDLAPLVKGLFGAGASEVRINLAATGDPMVRNGEEWERGVTGKTAEAGRMEDIGNWSFRTLDPGELPPPFAVRFGSGWTLSRLFVPLAFVLCGPAALALALRRRIARSASTPGSGMVWLNWILLGAWLYWISKVGLDDLIGFAAALDIDAWPVTLVLGTVLFCGPPLAAVAICLMALAPKTEEGSGPGAAWRRVRVGVASQALFVVPLGMFLMGTALVSEEMRAGLFSILAAYASFRALNWCIWRWKTQRMTVLTGGDLYARAMEIAGAAKVALKSLRVLENRSPLEANAFAAGGGQVTLTRGLVENLTRREVDSVLGHEIGHLRGKHGGTRLLFLLAYMFVVGPMADRFLGKAGLPAWALALPIVPMLYVLAGSWLSQQHELSADARAVALTGDAEGSIAALARLGRLTRLPMEWGGIQGSILSHPSMRKRVLAIARRGGVPDARALAILENPEVLGGAAEDAAAHYIVPMPVERREPVFTAAAKLSHMYWIKWFFGSCITGPLLGAHLIALRFGLGYGGKALAFAGCLPLVFWLVLAMDEWWSIRFIRRFRRKLERAGGDAPDGIFVALLPGERVQAHEGVYAWDLGRLGLNADRLTYRGERTQFSVGRGDVQSIAIARGPAAWTRTYVVMVRWPGGSFSLRLADRGRSKGLARRLEAMLLAWQRGEVAAQATDAEALPAPVLPNVIRSVRSRAGVAWYIARTSVIIGIGAYLVSSMVLGYGRTSLVPLSAAVIYLVTTAPALLRRKA